MSRTGKTRSTAPPRARGADAAPAGGGQGVAKTTRRTDEQRRGPRRQPRSDRAVALHSSAGGSRNWIPPRWPYLILTMVAAIASGIVATRGLPDLIGSVMLALAVTGVSLVRQAHFLVAQKGPWPRLVAVSAVAILPMFLFGLALNRWAAGGSLEWDVTIVSLICVAGVAAAYLRRQPGVLFAAQLSMWSAAVVTHASLAGAIMVLVAAAVSILVSREQLREQRFEEEQRRARDRVQTRARDILADYEETRQGWFWETDRRILLTYVSAPVAQELGETPDELIGQPLVTLFDLADTGQEGERTLQFHFTARSAFQELAVRAAVPGEERWWSVSGRPIHDEFGNFVGFRGSGTDLTEKKRSEEQASRLAKYDSLTGLMNRFEMSQTLEKILGSRQKANRTCAVMLIDLDRFKQVNDTMGHPAGDALLKQVAQRLERVAGQSGQVGRRGGDEFEVILPGSQTRKDIGHLAGQIIQALSQPYSIEGKRVIIGASIGVALSPDDGTASEELIRNADLALYAAKDLGRGRFHFFAEDLHAEAEARAQMEQDLRDAISRGELQLYYQPVVSTATERISGFEALLRWEHPAKGWIPTDKFVKIAEDTGLIAQIGEWALRTACHDLARWPEEVRVAVNVSPLQFANPHLPAIVTSAIAQAGVEPSRLELEITESVFLSDNEDTDTMFAALKGVGVRLALDDFGTGYSSLGYLKKAPFDKIKIDQSFVRGATQPGSRNGAIIASITSLAHSLGMDTTAEGVETLDELDLVRMHGCSHVQGFIYERPLSSDAATERLQSGLAAVARGPRAARQPRRTVLRRVVLDHDGRLYNCTVRNISAHGALVDGLWKVPVGTIFNVRLSDSEVVSATVRWCEEDRMGLEFAVPLPSDGKGQVAVMQGEAPKPTMRPQFKRTG